MRIIMNFAAVLALVALPAMAERGRYEAPAELPSVAVTFHALLDTVRTATAGRIVATVAGGSNAPAFIFPIVGSAPGAGGLYFRSETTIVNESDHPQNIAIFYFPAGGNNNCARSPRFFLMNANTWYIWSDFVQQMIGTSGLGSIVVFAVDSTGSNADTSAKLDGFTRIWTPVSSGGTASQSFTAESISFDVGTQSGWGLRHDPNFRTNVGVFNYDVVSRTFDVGITGVNGQTQTSLTVGPCSMILQLAPAGNYGPLELDITARDGRALWYGFGSSVDNISGDNWSSVLRH